MNIDGIRAVEKVSRIIKPHEKEDRQMERWSDDYECEGQISFDELLRKEIEKNGNDNRGNSAKVSEGGNSEREKRADSDFG